jgi:hypothetical protein
MTSSARWAAIILVAIAVWSFQVLSRGYPLTRRTKGSLNVNTLRSER